MTPRTVYAFLLVVFALSVNGAFGQQTPLTQFYRTNWQMANPAAIDRSLYVNTHHLTTVINAAYRYQWIGLEGAPQTYFVSAEYCPVIENRSRPGYKFGGTFVGDRTDALSVFRFSGNISGFFPMPYTKNHVLHIGLTAGMTQTSLKLEALNPGDPDDPLLAGGGLYNRRFIDFTPGIMYRVQRRFYIGASIPNLAIPINSKDFLGNLSLKREPHFYISGGWFIQYGERDYSDEASYDMLTWVFEPSFQVRGVPGALFQGIFLSPFSVDINARFHYMRKVWFGGGFGTNMMLNAECGFRFPSGGRLDNHMQSTFAFAYPVGKRSVNLGPTVELSLSYWID